MHLIQLGSGLIKKYMIYILVHFDEIKTQRKHVDIYDNMVEFNGLRF